MPLDKTAYDDLERLFTAQVERDKAHVMERVAQGCGIYLPCKEPVSQADYIIVGMEPSFGWADGIEDAGDENSRGIPELWSAQQPKGAIGALHALDRTIPLPTRRDLPPNGCVERCDAGVGGGPGP